MPIQLSTLGSFEDAGEESRDECERKRKSGAYNDGLSENDQPLITLVWREASNKQVDCQTRRLIQEDSQSSQSKVAKAK